MKNGALESGFFGLEGQRKGDGQLCPRRGARGAEGFLLGDIVSPSPFLRRWLRIGRCPAWLLADARLLLQRLKGSQPIGKRFQLRIDGFAERVRRQHVAALEA